MWGSVPWIVRRRAARVPMIYQAESCECGLACLAMVAARHGADLTLSALRERHPISLRGITLRHLAAIADDLQLDGRAVRCGSVNQLASLRLPAILHWDFEHFVVLAGLSRGRFVIHDPALGRLELTPDEISPHFTGVALELKPRESFGLADGERLSLTRLVRSAKGILPYLGEVLWLTAAVEVVTLISPFFISVALSAGVQALGADLLTALTLAFVVAVICNAIFAAARDYVVMEFGTALNRELVHRLVRHLLNLPLAFFERHNVGDLIDRVQATNNLRTLFSNNLPGVILDGIFSIAALAVMTFISPWLALIALTAFIAYGSLKWASRSRVRTAAEQVVQARSEESTQVIETIRSIQAVKIYGKETERLGIWDAYHSRLTAADRRVLKLGAWLRAARAMIQGIELALSILVAALAVRDNSLALTTVFAFLMLRTQFSTKAYDFVDRMLEMTTISVEIERIAEIVMAIPEARIHASGPTIANASQPAFEARGLGFRYAPTESDVFRNLDFVIEPGEFVAVTGPSGVGKTTLLKIMMGLVPPTYGTLLFEGRPIDRVDVAWLRARIGVVMQDDRILNGTVLDNITFYDSAPDDEAVVMAARRAMIEEEILRLPMKYNTRMGDLASALSGGQKQRLLLARALYRRPDFVFMDEGTANLDGLNEASILKNLKSMNITCVSIAHRPQVVDIADRVIEISSDGSTTRLKHQCSRNIGFR